MEKQAVQINSHILLFVKYPLKGKVKTRLRNGLDDNSVAALYRCFVLDTLDTLRKVGSHIWVCYWPQQYRKKFSNWLGGGYEYMPQRGADLGERLIYCFRRVFENGARRALVMGSDGPDIQVGHIREALNCLDDHEVVIGPSFDGGYYLLGFRPETLLPQVFENIPWGSDTVFKRTKGILDCYGKDYITLEKRYDIDTVQDINRLIAGNALGPFCDSRTMKFLRSLKKATPQTGHLI